ncbi:small ribosomal subunit protein bS21m [Anomaloglossus baeobatrachus]|uniref:small ribosomal subunit protein bS21m n=1 Tax=Anomaloglossus baeobatrachus TaxID=238106 RepID=UPI003F502270
MANHLRFIARTVMVQNGNVDAAYKNLNRILTTEGLVDEVKRRRYYEKPCDKRRRIKYETCQRIYNSEMARKIAFLSRTTRTDPWPGC